MDEIAKNMIPNAHSAERNQKRQCDIHQGKYGPIVNFDTQMLPVCSFVRILQGYLYAVTQHLITRRNFLFLNSLKGFQRSIAEIS
jgi:hypothetical protein